MATTAWSLKPLSARSLTRSEEHTSELQSHSDLVCRLLLEKKKKNTRMTSDARGGSSIVAIRRTYTDMARVGLEQIASTQTLLMMSRDTYVTLSADYTRACA